MADPIHLSSIPSVQPVEDVVMTTVESSELDGSISHISSSFDHTATPTPIQHQEPMMEDNLNVLVPSESHPPLPQIPPATVVPSTVSYLASTAFQSHHPNPSSSTPLTTSIPVLSSLSPTRMSGYLESTSSVLPIAAIPIATSSGPSTIRPPAQANENSKIESNIHYQQQPQQVASSSVPIPPLPSMPILAPSTLSNDAAAIAGLQARVTILETLCGMLIPRLNAAETELVSLRTQFDTFNRYGHLPPLESVNGLGPPPSSSSSSQLPNLSAPPVLDLHHQISIESTASHLTNQTAMSVAVDDSAKQKRPSHPSLPSSSPTAYFDPTVNPPPGVSYVPHPSPEYSRYLIGTDGSIFCSIKKQWLTGSIKNEHLNPTRIRLTNDLDQKRYAFARAHLVLLAHGQPQPTPKHIAKYRDGNKLNDSLANLYWELPTPKSKTTTSDASSAPTAPAASDQGLSVPSVEPHVIAPALFAAQPSSIPPVDDTAASSYRPASSLIADSSMTDEPQPFGGIFARVHELEKQQTALAAASTSLLPPPSSTASLKRKRSQQEPSKQTAAAAAATTASASTTTTSSSSREPVAGRYDDPSLIDVADANRDMEQLGDSAPGIYRGMLSLENELRELEAEREQQRLKPFQPTKRMKNAAGTYLVDSHDQTRRSIDTLLESEKEAMQYADVVDMKIDPYTGKIMVLASPTASGTDSGVRPQATWVHVQGLDGLSPAMVPRALLQKLKLHQLQGIKFILDNLLGRNNPDHYPTGCILADAMGLGKTLTVLGALHIFAQVQMDAGHPRPCFLLVGPPTVLKHWKNESIKLSGWLNDAVYEGGTDFTHAAQGSGRSWLIPTNSLDASVKAEERADVLKTWREQQGLLLIGYDMLRDIGTYSASASATSTTGSSAAPTLDDSMSDEFDLTGDDDHIPAAVSRDLLSYFQNPGPDVLVLDEAHKVRNLMSNVHQVLTTKIPTRRRILLSGYPLQNNLSELYAMIDFVRPAHLPIGHNLGSSKDFYRFFEVPVLKAQMSEDVMERRKARRRCWMLFDFMRKEHLMLRRSNMILVKQLPFPLYEIIVLIRFSAVQHRAYNALLEWHRIQGMKEGGQLRPLDIVQFVSMLLCHPQVIRKHCLDVTTAAASNTTAALPSTSSSDDAMVDTTDPNGVVESISSTASYSALLKRAFIDDVLPTSTVADNLPEHSGKMVLLLAILLQAKAVGDRVLIFSKWIHCLDYVEEMFRTYNTHFEARLKPEEFTQRSKERIRWGRFDGSTPQHERQQLIQQFGMSELVDTQHVPDVLLISTLCGEGINLCRANRVILLDVSWNPNHENQASHRIYRYGQTKPCYVYRFVVSHSMEEKMLLKQIRKEELSKWSLERKQVARNVGIATSAIDPSTLPAAQQDPTHIKRFFDSPPPMEKLLAETTSLRLSKSIKRDPVTSHLLYSYCNPIRKPLPIDPNIAPTEPNTWILEAFEQHSLIEDDTTTTSLYGEEETSAPVLPAEPPPVLSPEPVTAVPTTNVSTAPPVYYFGTPPVGWQPPKQPPKPATIAASAGPTATTTTSTSNQPKSTKSVVDLSADASTTRPPQPSSTAKAPRAKEERKESSPAAASIFATPPPAPLPPTNRVAIPGRTRPPSTATSPSPSSSQPKPTMQSSAPSQSVATTTTTAVPDSASFPKLSTELAHANDKRIQLAEARKQRKQNEDTVLFIQQQREEKLRKQKEEIRKSRQVQAPPPPPQSAKFSQSHRPIVPPARDSSRDRREDKSQRPRVAPTTTSLTPESPMSGIPDRPSTSKMCRYGSQCYSRFCTFDHPPSRTVPPPPTTQINNSQRVGPTNATHHGTKL